MTQLAKHYEKIRCKLKCRDVTDQGKWLGGWCVTPWAVSVVCYEVNLIIPLYCSKEFLKVILFNSTAY